MFIFSLIIPQKIPITLSSETIQVMCKTGRDKYCCRNWFKINVI